MSESTSNANFSTLMLLVLKEIRIERGVHQGFVAQMVGKTPSAWTKIENGQSPLSMDAIFGACSALQIQPSYAMTLVELLVPLFNARGYYFQAGSLSETEDQLLALVLKYFNSKGFETLKSRPYAKVAITSMGSPFAPGVIPTVVEYCCNPEIRNWMDNGAPEQNASIHPAALIDFPPTSTF